MSLRLVLVVALLVGAPVAARTVVPIHQTTLQDGTIRYSISLAVGTGAPIEAMLDSGSVGLRVLPGVVSDVQTTDQASQYAYGSGVELNGLVGMAALHFGDLSTDQPVPIELVRNIGCVASLPDCPAVRVPLPAYGLGGNGIPGAGFPAILGVSLRSGVDVNPLLRVGTRQWIIHLPRAGDGGALIIDPDAQDLVGFHLFGLGTGAPVCVEGAGQSSLCGRATMDTGSPGVVLHSPLFDGAGAWPAGVAVDLRFGAPGDGLTDSFASGSTPATRVVVARPRGRCRT